MIIDLGTCPFVVTDAESADAAGEWAQNLAVILMGREDAKGAILNTPAL